MKSINFEISGEYIELIKLLKATGRSGTGPCRDTPSPTRNRWVTERDWVGSALLIGGALRHYTYKSGSLTHMSASLLY